RPHLGGRGRRARRRRVALAARGRPEVLIVRDSGSMMRRALLVLVAALAVFASGCFSEPSMKLYGARITHATPYGVGLTMQMAVENHNSIDVMVRDVRADVVL